MKIFRYAKKAFNYYLENAWLAPVLALGLFIWLIVVGLSNIQPLLVMDDPMIIVDAVAFIGLFATGLRNLILKRRLRGVIHLCIVLLFFSTVVLVGLFLSAFLGLNSNQDGFADHLSIPKTIEVVKPLEDVWQTSDEMTEPFEADLLQALQISGDNDSIVTAKLDSLYFLQKNEPQLLKRYLASSPDWRVFKERQAVFAIRRLTEVSKSFDEPIDFQISITIGLSRQPWSGNMTDSTCLGLGETAALTLCFDNENRLWSSNCFICAGELTLTIYEQTKIKERRLTKAALQYFEDEMRPLCTSPNWSTIDAILQPNHIRKGKPSLMLRNSFQPGIYESEIWVNPEESGRIYLKAYEVTHGTPLSTEDLPNKTNEWVGWSADPTQLFYANAHFNIYEGDWGKPYAARFEVWFIPDSGQKERKLMERVFKIEGWQR